MTACFKSRVMINSSSCIQIPWKIPVIYLGAHGEIVAEGKSCRPPVTQTGLDRKHPGDPALHLFLIQTMEEGPGRPLCHIPQAGHPASGEGGCKFPTVLLHITGSREERLRLILEKIDLQQTKE